MSISREAYRYQRNSCCFSTGGFAKLNRLKGQTEEQQQQQEQGQEEEQERAAALSFVPCHVGNFHGQRWAFGPDLTTALRNANAQSVAQMRRCAENSVSSSRFYLNTLSLPRQGQTEGNAAKRDDLRRFKKRKASEKSSISVAERRQLLEARPTINFRDPIRNAQLDVCNLYC